MSNGRRRSVWRDNERWRAGLAQDHEALGARLSAEQTEALDGVVAQFEAKDERRLSFVVVFGSQARGEADDESDLAIYAEANIPRLRGSSIPGYDFLVNPNGTLMGGANLAVAMSNDVIRDALIWLDEQSEE